MKEELARYRRMRGNERVCTVTSTNRSHLNMMHEAAKPIEYVNLGVGIDEIVDVDAIGINAFAFVRFTDGEGKECGKLDRVAVHTNETGRIGIALPINALDSVSIKDEADIARVAIPFYLGYRARMRQDAQFVINSVDGSWRIED